MPELAEWDSFYLIVGSAAGALIGLQFVVMTLIASRPQQAGIEVADAFATPTIIHFGVAFLLSAVIRMPWKTLVEAGALLAAIGLIGLVYTVIVTRRMQTQRSYKPVFEDWLFHAILPLIAYVVIAASAFAAFSYERPALFGIGASTLLLLFIGIHNSWDTVTYNVFVNTPNPEFADTGSIESSAASNETAPTEHQKQR
jgi:hypothetical protein